MSPDLQEEMKNIENDKHLDKHRASLVTQMIKSLPAVQETRVRALSQEDLPEKGTATHSSILACRIPWTEETGGSMGPQSQTQLSN